MAPRKPKTKKPAAAAGEEEEEIANAATAGDGGNNAAAGGGRDKSNLRAWFGQSEKCTDAAAGDGSGGHAVSSTTKPSRTDATAGKDEIPRPQLDLTQKNHATDIAAAINTGHTQHTDAMPASLAEGLEAAQPTDGVTIVAPQKRKRGTKAPTGKRGTSSSGQGTGAAVGRDMGLAQNQNVQDDIAAASSTGHTQHTDAMPASLAEGLETAEPNDGVTIDALQKRKCSIKGQGKPGPSSSGQGTGAAVGRDMGLTQNQNVQDSSATPQVGGDKRGTGHTNAPMPKRTLRTQPSIDLNLVEMLYKTVKQLTLEPYDLKDMDGIIRLVRAHVKNFKKVFDPMMEHPMAPNTVLTVGTLCTGSSIDVVVFVAIRLVMKEWYPGLGIRYLFNCEIEPWKRKWIYEVHKACEDFLDQGLPDEGDSKNPPQALGKVKLNHACS